MAKTKKARKGTKVKKQPRAQARAAQGASREIVKASTPVLDTAAARYAKLIADPCNAPLTTTIWPGSTGSFVGRFEQDFITGAGLNSIGGCVVYCPGVNQVWIEGATVTADTNGFVLAPQAIVAYSPGGAFLIPPNVGSFRPVAACMQVMFVGTELNRSGVVSCGVIRSETILNNISTGGGGGNVNTTLAQLRTLSQHTERTPQEMCEITWRPGPGDMESYSTVVSSLVAVDGRSSLLATFSGLPITTGVRVRIVTVFEWTPAANSGMVSTVETPKSTNTLNDVLMALDKAGGSNWFINAYKKAAPYARAVGSGIMYGAKMLGPALLAI